MTTKKRVVVKIGTAVLSRAEGGLNMGRIRSLAEEMAEIQKDGYSVLLVSSGAIGAGMDSFGFQQRPTVLRDKQAVAAVGQVILMEAYKNAFARHNVTVAQMLLTQADLEDRTRYLNARHTLSALLNRKVIPVINENDTVSTEEIQFGDNDSLAAMVAVKMEAKTLCLLTDVEGLLTGTGDNARILPEVFQLTPDIEALVSAKTGSHKSAGGMASKIQAAHKAMSSGVETWIASGRRMNVVHEILKGQGIGTCFQPQQDTPLNARKRWIAFGRRVKGAVYLDDGAVNALVHNKRSLLPSGVVRVEGQFNAGDTVRLMNSAGREMARGLIAYSSHDTKKIRGKKSIEIEKILGHPAPAEVIHRNNLVVL